MNLEGLAPWGGLARAPMESAKVVVTGIPHDGSAVYRRGAALAPAELRRLSAALPPVTEAGRLLAPMVHDMGDVCLGGRGVEDAWSEISDQLSRIPHDAFLTVLGGDHCSAVPVLAAQRRRQPDLALVWVDAHPDLCDVSRGSAWSCGCALRRALETSGLAPDSVYLAGCRDFDPEELEWIDSHGTLMIPAASLADDPGAAGLAVARASAGRPMHVSVDIDVLDPAYAPGTEIASAGGLSTRQLLEFLQAMAKGSHLVGLDLMEVCPPVDHADITSLAALKVIFEVWGMAAL